MVKKDLFLGIIIGVGVGLLIQPVLMNSNTLTPLADFVKLSLPVLRVLIFFLFLALAPLALAVAKWLARFVPVVYQIAKFAAVGTLNSFIDLGFFNLAGLLLGSPEGGSIQFVAMKSFSFVIAATNSFFWNRFWTFEDKDMSHTGGKAVKFFTVTGLNWLVNVAVATGISALAPTNILIVNVIAPVVSIFIGMAGNFLGYKFIVFAQKKTIADPSA